MHNEGMKLTVTNPPTRIFSVIHKRSNVSVKLILYFPDHRYISKEIVRIIPNLNDEK